MSLPSSTLSWISAWALAALSGAAGAQVTGAPAPAETTASAGSLEAVNVKGVKDPATLPVRFIYMLNRVVAEKAEGRWVARWRVTGPDRMSLVPGVRLWIEGKSDEEITPVQVDGQGLVAWPAMPQAQADVSELVSNQRKGAMRLKGEFESTLPADGMSTTDFARSVDVLERAWKEVKGQIPWAFRWVIPSYNGVGICQPDRSAEAYWEGPQGRTALMYMHKTKGRWAGMQCAVVRSGAKLPEGARLVAAPGTRLIPWLPGITGDQVSYE